MHGSLKTFTKRNLPRLLLEAREAVLQRSSPVRIEAGLSDAQWRVLHVLNDIGRVETGRLRNEACILGPSLTVVLERLDSEGFVHRQWDEADKRRRLVWISEKGRHAIETSAKALLNDFDRVRHALGEDKLFDLCELLEAVVELKTCNDSGDA